MPSVQQPEMVTPPEIMQPHRATLRLLVIPFLIYLAWLTEIYLLASSRSLFLAPEFFPVILYTVVGCVLTGIVVPVIVIRRSFVSGAVNMYQIGFRSLRRTTATFLCTAVPLLVVLLAVLPPGTGRSEFLAVFVLFLPSGISAVMVCWVLFGTHLQALVRYGGVLVSITTGVVITAILFALSTLVLSAAPAAGDLLIAAIVLGMVTALLFFAARDVYVAVLVVTAGMSFLSFDRVNAPALSSAFPVLVPAAGIALSALFGVHWYLSSHYATVLVRNDR